MSIFYVLQGIPNFGPYRAQREEALGAYKEKADLLDEENKPKPHRPHAQPKLPVPTVKVCASRYHKPVD